MAALAGAALLLTGCGKNASKPLTGTGRVLVRLTEWQLPWFESRVQAFSRERKIDLKVDSYQLITDVESMLRRARDRGETPVLVKVEGRMIPRLVEQGLLRPLRDAVPEEQLRQDLLEYLPRALAPVRIGGKIWGIPRKLEVMVLAYHRGAIRQAVSEAPARREEFRRVMAEVGLEVPADHELEFEPREWDLVDLAEVAYSLHLDPIRGRTTARFAHRTADIEGTPTDLACLIYPLGYRAGRLEDMPGFAPFLKLEAALYGAGALPPLGRDGEYTPQLFAGWKRGDYRLSFFQQIDAWRLIGRDAASSWVPEREQVDFAPLPRGGPWRVGEADHRVPSGGWWWCLPAGGPAPDLGYALARFVTSREAHYEECRRFGMMPVRRDLADDLGGTFEEPRLRRLMEVSFEALEDGAAKPAPGGDAYDRWRRAIEERAH